MFYLKNNLLHLKKIIKNKKNENIYFQTSEINNQKDIKFRITNSFYPLDKPIDLITYKPYLDKTPRALSVCFMNLNKDTLLVIPGKPYRNIYDFAVNSTDREWLALWRKVKYITKNLHSYFISTHGHGVSYLHIRIELFPKHYSW